MEVVDRNCLANLWNFRFEKIFFAIEMSKTGHAHMHIPQISFQSFDFGRTDWAFHVKEF